MSLSHILSLAFFVAFSIYFILGIYIITINVKKSLYKLFFAVCLSLCIWAFSFSIANSAPDYETAIFWRRLNSFGWGIAYSFLVHFLLILTERKKILKSKLIYLLLYIPALVNIFEFGLSDSASIHYNLLKTPAGWINISPNTWGDLYFNIYYISFSIAGLFLLWDWGRKTTDRVKKKQAYILIASFAVTIILGTLTDIIVNKYTSFRIPQIAPIISLVPITAIFYSIKQYGLMNQKKSDKVESGKILSEVTLEKFIRIMSLVFIFGGLLNFAAQNFFDLTNPNLESILLSSFLFIILGMMLLIIKLIPIEINHKEDLFFILMLISVIAITIKYIDNASITVWTTPICIIMMSVLFNKRRMIFWIGIPM